MVGSLKNVQKMLKDSKRHSQVININIATTFVSFDFSMDCSFSAALVLYVTTTAAWASPSVMVPNLGELKGKDSISDGDVALFLNIPYAKPPVGHLRWSLPEAYGPWVSPRDATSYGNVCRGATFDRPGGPTLSEDCLTLNIAARTANLNSTTKQPVMVWFYGGAFDNGDADSYAPGAMVGNSELPVIVVTLNYRINMFGFLGSKALAARSPDGSTGNYGIQVPTSTMVKTCQIQCMTASALSRAMPQGTPGSALCS